MVFSGTLISTFLLGFLITVHVKAENDKLLFCGHEEFPPYSFYSNGQLSGYVVDLTRILSVTINRDIKINLTSWNKCIELIKTREIDGLIGAPVFREREEYMLYSDPVAEVNMPYLWKKEQNTFILLNPSKELL